MPKKNFKITVLPGDGIGKEVMREGIKVLQKVEGLTNYNFELTEYDCGGEYFLKTGKEWEEDAYTNCQSADSILLGAVGWPGAILPNRNIAGAGVIFGLRFGLDLYANVRPTKLFEGIHHKVHNKSKQVWEPGLVDLITVRENTEGLYTPTRGKLSRGGVDEVAIDTRVITNKGARRVIKYAFELSKRRQKGSPGDGKKRVTCVDKSNVLDGCRLFRSIYDEVAVEFPEIEKDYAYIDAYTQWLVRNPEWFDVVVTTNMLGDIASDLSSVLAGSLGMAPSGNIGDRHAFFEPVHGSAPKHAGKNKVNPMAMIFSVSMMLDHLSNKFDEPDLLVASKKVDKAIETVIKDHKILTYDLGGTSSTEQVGTEISSILGKIF